MNKEIMLSKIKRYIANKYEYNIKVILEREIFLFLKKYDKI